uniref:Ig-like domain-containing protein n=1 Tax=Aotus nancymaae TaxID=37293 RepID=A0A2K5E192_AOTNA
MARRLPGANGATVFNIEEPGEETARQEYKVSSCKHRLENRLERAPVDAAGDEVQFGDVPILEGMPETFTCRVAGNPKPKICWFKDGKQISPKSDHCTCSKPAIHSLHTIASTLDDDGSYIIMGPSPHSPSGHPHVRRSHSRSRDSGDENEPIQEWFFRPHFLQAPVDLTVQEGKLCRMHCKVSGLPTSDRSWQLDGKPIRPDNAHKMLVRENGVHSLIVEPVTSHDTFIYTGIATNQAGQNSVSLELAIAAKEKLQNTGVADGYPVRLECHVLGVPPPPIFWNKEDESPTRMSMHQDNHGYICLLIQGAAKEDAGWYTMSAKSEAGIVSCTARVDIYTQWRQKSQSSKPKNVRPSASRYAAVSDHGLHIKAEFQPEANPSPLSLNAALVESENL